MLQSMFIGCCVVITSMASRGSAIGGRTTLLVSCGTLTYFVDHIISTRQPDIVVIDKCASLITLIDISVPADKRISAKEEEKLSKY